MTQTLPPSEIKCPHCGQPYAIQPAQWPQYQGKSIACTKCGQSFVVGVSAQGVAPLPPPLPLGTAFPQQQQYFPPPKKGLGGGAIAAIVIGVLCLFAIPCVIAILLPALSKVREEALKAKCSSNLKNIASAMITYSNANNGKYPDSMVTLIRTSGLPASFYVCPASNDTPLTVPLASVTAADLSGHVSYVYVAGGMTSASTATDVLAYDDPTDHNSKGVNVLYGDYHVAWMPQPAARQMIQSLPPPPVTSGP